MSRGAVVWRSASQPSDDPVERFFRALDDDTNCKISAAEWQRAFDGIDRDSDGIITRKEFALAGGDTRMFDSFDRRHKCALRRIEWQEAFRSVDADQSSEITVAEWRQWVNNATSRVGLASKQAERLAEARDRRRREELPSDRKQGTELSKALKAGGAAKPRQQVRLDVTPSFAPEPTKPLAPESSAERGTSDKLESTLGALRQSLAADRAGTADEARRLCEQAVESLPECVRACRSMEERLVQLGRVEVDEDGSLVAVSCLCGNVFHDDSMFCRKCGRKRTHESPTDVLRRRMRRLLTEATREGRLVPALNYAARCRSKRRTVVCTGELVAQGSYGQLVSFLRECHSNNRGQLPGAKLHQLLAAVEDLGRGGSAKEECMRTTLVKARAREEGQEEAFSDIMGNLGIAVQRSDTKEAKGPTLARASSRRCSVFSNAGHTGLDPIALMNDLNFDSRSKIGNKKRDVQLLVSLCDTPFELLSKYDIDEDKLTAWMEAVADQYPDPSVVGYHNWRHAVEVFQFSFRSLHKGGAGDYFSLKDMLALLMASVGHDVAHPGTNNAFQVKTRSKLATLYNDKSVLENMHASVFFELAKEPNRGWMEAFAQKHYDKFRAKVIEAILATDMAHHFELVDRFSTRVSKKDDNPFFTRFEEPDAENVEMQKATKADRMMLIQAFVHMADLGHCARPWDIHKHLVAGLEVEFFSQGDRERELGLPVMPLMDRTRDNLASAQDFFLGQLVLPLLTPYVDFLEETLAIDYLETLDNNRERWKELVSKHGKKMISEILALEEPE